MKVWNSIRVCISFLLICGLLVTGYSTSVKADSANSLTSAAEAKESSEDLLDIVHDAVTYEEYLEQHDAEYPDMEIVLYGGEFTEASETFESKEDYMGYGSSVALTREEGSILWEFDVAEAGYYSILIEYYPITGKGSDIEREVYINGEIPFDGAQYIELSRCWRNDSEIVRDSRDNDIRPKQIEVQEWMRDYFSDSEGFHPDAYSFYFKEGTNTLELVSIKEPLAIGKIILTQEEGKPSYEEYISEMRTQGHLEVQLDNPIKLQGENAALKSHSTLYPITDRSSPATEPYNPSKIRLNSIGGTNWRLNGQWITWEFTAPEDGLYEIALKYRQNLQTGRTVVRSFSIDGNIPFAEAKEMLFYYDNDWQIAKLGNDEEAYLFYFPKGTHTLTFEVSLGDELSDILRQTEECILNLNIAYRKMLMVIGSSPDTMRDYQLELKTPDALKILEEQYTRIVELSEKVDHYSKGKKGSDATALDKLINQLYTMYTEPDIIAKSWAAFKDNISSLGTWSLNMKEQPLEVDYLLIQEAGSELPKAKAGFFAKVWHEIRCFIASFFEDYDSIGEIYEGDALDVWLLASGSTVTSTSSSGRDQSQVIKDLVDNYFVPEKNIPVNIKLVNSGVLLSATLAGKGPDVAVNVAGKEPVNYALRNAAVDLTQFEDFEEVKEYFHPTAMNTFTLEGGVYALPQTMSFHVLYYRADILKDLGLEIPTTWDEFYECLAVIQKNNMNVGIVPDYTTFAMFLYQHGGSYYQDNGRQSGLSSEEAIQAFKQWTSNYTNYGMPITFDFANRFRTGEMPLAIGDYTNYNYLSVFAPEIRGLWGFTTVPGYADENGNIDKSVSSWVTASMLLETSDQKEEGWEFLKWWMGEETQTSYGNEMENILGIAGRVATANMAALEKLPWSNRDYKQLSNQLAWVQTLPEVPGGYFTERHISNAFYTVYNSKEDPRETLEDYVKTINNEITNKRLEFGLETAD